MFSKVGTKENDYHIVGSNQRVAYMCIVVLLCVPDWPGTQLDTWMGLALNLKCLTSSKRTLKHREAETNTTGQGCYLGDENAALRHSCYFHEISQN